MGATYTRQSSSGIVDGGVIEATDLNNEFDQLLAAFAVSSGHTHDGTAAEGGPITKLLGTSITIGDGTSGTDIAVTFDGESADGVLTWMEDEDYFKFSDEVLMNSTEKLLFGDTGTYIHQSADGVLDLVSDSEIEINATTIDINGAVDISGNATVGGDLTVTGDDITMGTNTSGMLLVADGTNFNPVAVSGDVTMASTGAITIASTAVENSMLAGSIADSKLSTISTADKVSGAAIQIDGATDGTSITVADADKILIDDAGTTKYITASQLNTYTSGSVAADNVSTGDAAVTIATSSGDITIDAQAGDADIIFKGTDSSSDITALTLDMSAAGAATFNDKIVATELDISGDVDVDGTLEADAITINGTTLAETIADTVGAMVTSNTESGITVAYDDADNTLDFTVGTLNQDTTGTAAIATAVTITDNESTNEDNAIIFTAGGDVDGGNLGLESDGTLTYNPSTGKITATGFIGTLTGNVTGNASGTAATVTTAAQSNITSLGTLTTLTVDNIITDGTTIGHTSDTDLLTLTSGVLTVAGEVSMTTLDIGGTNITATAAELNYCDGVTSNIQTQLTALDPTPIAIALGWVKLIIIKKEKQTNGEYI